MLVSLIHNYILFLASAKKTIYGNELVWTPRDFPYPAIYYVNFFPEKRRKIISEGRVDKELIS